MKTTGSCLVLTFCHPCGGKRSFSKDSKSYNFSKSRMFIRDQQKHLMKT